MYTRLKAIKMKIKLLFYILFILPSGLLGQEVTKADLKRALDDCDCYLKAMKPYANINKKDWDIVEWAPKNMKRGDEVTLIQHDCGPGVSKQGWYNHPQVVSSIQKTTANCNDIRKRYQNFSGTSESGGSGGMSEAEQRRADFQRSLNNLRNYSQIRNEAIARNKAVSRELAHFAQIANNGDPLSIMQQYRSNLESIENIGQQLKSDIFNSTVNNAVNIVGDYQSGNYEGVLYSGAGMLEAAFENAEARKEVERQKAELERQRRQAMRNAANKLIEANTQAAQKWWSSAAQASDEAQERYFKQKAYYHFGYSNYVSSRFNASNTNWARYPSKSPVQPSFGNYYPNNAQYHHRAALRKMAAYREMSSDGKHDQKYLDQWLQGALDQYAAALAEEPENSRYYLEMAEAARGYNVPLALQSYSRAYQIRPGSFSAEEKEHFKQLLSDTEELILAALRDDEPDQVRPYLYHGLYELIKLQGESIWQGAMRYPCPKVTQLLYTEELMTYPAAKRQRIVQEATLIAAEKANLATLRFLAEENFDFDYRYRRKSPLDAAAQYSQVETFRYLLYQSKDRQRAQAPFGGTGLLAMALAPRYPAEAAQQLCAIKQEQDWDRTLRTMLNDMVIFQENMAPSSSLPDKLVFDGQEDATEYDEQIDKLAGMIGQSREEVQRMVEQEFLKAKEENVSRRPNADFNTQTTTEERQKTSTNYLHALSMCSRALRAIKTDPELQQLAIERFENDLLYRGARLSVNILDAEILNDEYLKSHKSTITRNALRHDNSALLVSLKERELLAMQDEKGNPMAHYFTVFGRDILNSGLYQNFDLNARDNRELSLAHKLVFTNRSSLLTALAQSGKLNLNQPGPHGWTALHYAARENRRDLVEALLAAGADKKAEDEWGRRPYDIAKERRFKSLKQMLK